MAQLSAFADEAAEKFTAQIEFLCQQKIGHIELRFCDGKNIMEIDQPELSNINRILQDHAIKVNAIGSPIGKVPLDEPFPAHLEKFKHAIELAEYFDAPMIRIFSFYPPAGKNIIDCRTEVMDRLATQVDLLKDTNITLVHENEADIYGQTAQRCLDIVQTINSPKLKLAYDPGNFVVTEKITNNMETCWPLMKDYVAHIHIKDRKVNAKTGCLPGTGDGQIKQLLTELAKINYTGFLTLEPHMAVSGAFSGFTGPELFARAVAAVRQLAQDVGLDCD